ncbi:Stk1 family PASTA domain-containing Ser/Thr kinase [Anaerorhabdus sp.]|uniref:Stk1 family PASTA domain-containing Ser/Thr kinase n=1 Tax=Anaerorhabdus sp. TaxID=1872524 RepID=UPI002B1FB707|nr:Stk1 family PASTA domain-containing Ser/Thr kinase [Anaerorhabdus sp.]MEA4874138.1 Stk1 family PASTA domain-containing Ser/Thr kinase [Anaerorhabdus sp.]
MNETIANRYILTKHIGQGGMADVYVAVDIILNREVAVKVLRGELSSDPVALLRFQREASASTALSHPNIVDIYDVGEDKGRHFIVMEYIRGKTLKQLINQRGALCKEEAIDIMKQLVSATVEAHRKGIIHRDIKSQNVIVKDDGTIKMLDFGIALAQGALQLTQSDSVMGSVHYLAPELARGESATNQSDIYSLGIVFYELLTGEIPFQADAPVQVALKHMRNEIPSVRDFNPSLPQSVENIVIKATVKNKAYRYSSCIEMLNDLNACLLPKHANDKKLVFTSKASGGQTMAYRQVDDNDDETQPKVKKKVPVKRKKSILPKIIGSLIVVLTIGVIYMLVTLTGILDPITKRYVVPDILGIAVTEAKTICTENSLVLDTSNVTYQLTDNTPKGQIIAVSPEVGTSVEKGSRVQVTVSSGIGVNMKNYQGWNVKEAKNDLSQYKNMRVLTIGEDSTDVPPGQVIRQELLLPDQQFNPETATEVRLVFANYPSIVIPFNIKGMMIEDAKTTLESLGAEVMLSTLDTSNLTEEEKANLSYGVVIDTSPALGSAYTQEEGTYIILYYY